MKTNIKLKDIVTNTTSYGDTYNIDTELVGRVLINDDNSFEGIIFNGNKSFLVMGNFNKNNIIMLQKDEEIDRLYKVEKDGEIYYGDCFIKSDDFEYPIGESIIKFINPKEYREPYISEEINEVQEQIKRKKTTRK